MAIRFEVHRSGNYSQPYYWRIVSVGNNKVLASSETYRNKQDAIDAFNIVFREAGSATWQDYT